MYSVDIDTRETDSALTDCLFIHCIKLSIDDNYRLRLCTLEVVAL